MKQIVFKSGKAVCIEVPPPQVQAKQILVDVRASCISPGTEMAGLNASAKTLWQKAKENPEKVKAAFERMKVEGLFSVLHKAQAKQEIEGLCGYSAAGTVKAVGSEISGFSKGMRVAIAGAGFANHAEMAAVPVNLVVPIPDAVPFEDASTCALGGIALQGIRRAETSIGDFVAVIGCGAIGLLTVQMLRAAGCRVIGIDLDTKRLALAKTLGAEFVFSPAQEDVVRKVMHVCNGQGVDRVILTVATSSPEPVRQAFAMSRRKGRVVLVGVAGMELEREEMYRKELDFVISTSYGPGRYDERYEQQGVDYPYAYVRWTEQRNMQAYLQMIADGSVKLEQIINGAYPVDQAEAAYHALKSEEKPLLVLLAYNNAKEEFLATKDHKETQKENDLISDIRSLTSGSRPPTSVLCPLSSGKSWAPPKDGILKVGLVGTGAFVQDMHIPNLKMMGDRFKVQAVCDQSVVAGRQAGRSLENPDICVETDYGRFLESDINMVLIGTRHNTHADLAIRALQSGKAVFVEKPMCIARDEFEELKSVLEQTGAPFMVGYNRRFAPAVQMIRRTTDKRVNPLMVHYTMNAGYIPYDAWVHTEEGGGRIIGEACHIFDLFRSLTGSPAESVSVDGIHPKTASVRSSDNVLVTVKYADGSVCSLLYTGLGNKTAPKERMEVFCDEQMFVLTDYIKLESFGTRCNWESKQADKGHRAELEFFAEQVKSGNRFPIPLDQMEETWMISRQVADLLTV